MSKKRLTLEEFIKRANIIHDNFYNYSKVNYINCYTKIIIICYEHGEFKQKPSCHLNKRGCSECSKNKKLTKEEWVILANEFHNYIYDYSEVIYINSCTKIKCEQHGCFLQQPRNHLLSGCPACGKKPRLTTKLFKEKCNLIHDSYYDYSKVNFINCNSKVIIICHEHKEFEQVAKIHLKGSDCPKCVSSISKMSQKWLDSIEIPDDKERREKTIFINGKKFRLDGFDPVTNTVYEFYGDFWHGNLNKFKPEQINTISKISYGNLYQKTLDREKILLDAGYNLKTCWASDFTKQQKSKL